MIFGFIIMPTNVIIIGKDESGEIMLHNMVDNPGLSDESELRD